MNEMNDDLPTAGTEPVPGVEPGTELEAKADSSDDSEEATEPEVVLCLSGGGYRSALFHLGVMRCLHEMGILQSVTTVSSVSGGSIISGYIAKRMFEEGMDEGIKFSDWDKQISKGFRAFAKKDVRTGPILLHLLWNWLWPTPRSRHLQWNYNSKLLKVKKEGHNGSFLLSHLRTCPQFVFCATDLNFGANWEFRREKVGDYKAGTAKREKWQVAKAITASSSFPPVFGPMRLWLDPKEFKTKYGGDDRKKLLRPMNINDGGVYDNLGLEPAKRHDVVIISDGGSPFGYTGITGPIKRISRNLPVIMNQVASLRKRMYFTGITKDWHDGVYIDIGHERKTKKTPGVFDGYFDKDVRAMIASIRTDLDKFSDEEAMILENHGYFEMYRRIIGVAPEFLANGQFTPTSPHPKMEDSDAVKKALKWSHKRKLFGIPLPL